MLKKAGIVVAAAAAGLLAVSPLAFAGESAAHGHGYAHTEGHEHGTDADSVSYDHSSTCDFHAENSDDTAQDSYGYTATYGVLGPISNSAAPSNSQTQSPMLSCNNISDLGNVTTTNTTVDDSDNTTVNKSVTDGSFNSLLPPM